MSRQFYNVGNTSVRLTKVWRIKKDQKKPTEQCKKVLAGSNPKNFEHFIVRPVQSQIEKCPVTLTMSEENEKLRIRKI